MMNMVAEQSDGDVIWKGIVFFVVTLFPYFFLVSGFVFPSFFNSHKNEDRYNYLVDQQNPDMGQRGVNPV